MRRFRSRSDVVFHRIGAPVKKVLAASSHPNNAGECCWTFRKQKVLRGHVRNARDFISTSNAVEVSVALDYSRPTTLIS